MIKTKKNPDKEKYERVTKAVKDNFGYCPCIIEHNESTVCMCDEFRQQVKDGYIGECRCGRYVSYEDKEDVHSGNGVKLDAGKPKWSLLPFRELKEVVEILTFGAEKYAPNNWQKVDPPSRYTDACLRHLTAWVQGEKKDAESGKSHLAHAVCCLLFLMWFDNEGKF